MKEDLKLILQIFSTEKLLLLSPFFLISLSSCLLFSSFCVFDGLQKDFLDLIGKRSHITIKPSKDYFFEHPEKLIEKLESQGSGVKVQPILESQALIHAKNQATGVIVKATAGAIQKKFSDYVSPIAMSKSLSNMLGLSINDEFDLVGPDGGHNKVRLLRLIDDYGWPEKKYTTEMDLSSAQALLFGESIINRLDITLKEYSDSKVLSAFKSRFNDYYVESWMDQYSETLKLFRAQKKLHYYLLPILILFCSISVYCAFYLVYLRKSPSFRNLLMLGMQRERLKSVVSRATHIWLVLSLFCGTFISYCFSLILRAFPIELPQSLFYSSHLPFRWNWAFLLLTISFLGFVTEVSMRSVTREFSR